MEKNWEKHQISFPGLFMYLSTPICALSHKYMHILTFKPAYTTCVCACTQTNTHTHMCICACVQTMKYIEYTTLHYIRTEILVTDKCTFCTLYVRELWRSHGFVGKGLALRIYWTDRSLKIYLMGYMKHLRRQKVCLNLQPLSMEAPWVRQTKI